MSLNFGYEEQKVKTEDFSSAESKIAINTIGILTNITEITMCSKGIH